MSLDLFYFTKYVLLMSTETFFLRMSRFLIFLSFMVAITDSYEVAVGKSYMKFVLNLNTRFVCKIFELDLKLEGLFNSQESKGLS